MFDLFVTFVIFVGFLAFGALLFKIEKVMRAQSIEVWFGYTALGATVLLIVSLLMILGDRFTAFGWVVFAFTLLALAGFLLHLTRQPATHAANTAHQARL